MEFDFRLPNITAKDPAAQVKQMQSYMYQLVEKLNVALTTVERKTEEVEEAQKSATTASDPVESASNTFASIKELIIKSGDIIEAYTEALERTYDSRYVATSDYGTFVEETNMIIRETAENITNILTDIQTINDYIVATNAYIRTGILDNTGTVPIIGVEVGQETTEDGVTVFNKFSRFTAEGVFFYLNTSTDPVAWMTGKKLYITNAEITTSLRLGGYIVDLSNGVAFKWAM